MAAGNGGGQTGDYEIRNPEIEQLLRDVGHKLAELMPPGYGFTLLIYGFGESKDLFYLSNANRQDMLKALREFIAKQGVV